MNVNELTLGDVAEVEDLSGQPLASLSDTKAPKGKLMVALAYIIKRKQDPKFTLEHAKKLTMEEIEGLFDENPTKTD
jgi:hypothetical protein